MVNTQTLTAGAEGDGHEAAHQVRARLVFLANAEAPELMSSSHALDEVDEVRFRRGDRSVERKGGVLTLAFPDARMSSNHGRLVRHDTRWVLDDPSSHNGTQVDFEPARRTILAGRAVLELGRSFFLFIQGPVAEVPAYLAGDTVANKLPPWPRGMATFSPALGAAFEALARLAASTASILILGETGTGKELVAKAIHALSNRTGEFVPVNCAAIPPALVESEVFGHRRGAFSGAVSDRKGFARSADGGTLFLDEIGELPGEVQAKFLRVLQEREVQPVGEDRYVRVDLRVIAATLRRLDAAMADGKFRADLYARIAGHIVEVPALRERREDLGLLLADLLARTGRRMRVSWQAMRALVRHDWPHNIRELEQALSTAVTLAPGEVIELAHLPAALRGRRDSQPMPAVAAAAPPPPLELDDEDRALRERVVATLREHRGNVHAAAEALGKRRQQLYKWIDRFRIDLSSLRQG